MPEDKAKAIIELQMPSTIKSLVEALIFAAGEPLTINQIKAIYLGDGAQAFLRSIDFDEIVRAITDLNTEFDRAEKPYRIVQIAGGYQFATLPSYAEWLGRLHKEQGRRKLSQSGVETLAIVAYKQPITKADIETIRGVNCDYVLKTLLEKELVTVAGRAHAPGRPLLYGTTREFLKHFGLNEVTDLPRPREIEEILGESQFETERRMLEAQAGAEKMREEEPDFKSRLPHIPKKKSDLDRSVEIVPKRNQKEIKTVRTDQNKVADQPAIEFVESKKEEPATSTNIVTMDPRGLKEIEEGGVKDLHRQTDELKSSTGQKTTAMSEELPKVHETNANIPEVPPMTAENRISDPTLSGSGELTEPGFVDGRVVNSQSNQLFDAKKSKWQSWKEKVQGFIKKIFG
jgi:segregation and condensation protein B